MPGFRFRRVFRLTVLAILWLGILVGSAAQAGRLAGATSPYLLLHADDAIDWHPWGKDALRRAEREGKLIFLSIGYATCYWCHVLSRTTFADTRVIAALNEHFISILVDREERPDLDHHFAGVMAAMTGRSGWPANFVLTPDLTPLFAAGYIAPEPEYGAPGLLMVARSLVTEWRDNREAVLRDAAANGEQLRTLFAATPAGAAQGREDPRVLAMEAWSASFDPDYGGFGRGEKFLLPNVLSFLLRQGVGRGDRELLANLYRTLDQMAAGGVRDHLGGAFHRYAVDRFWQVPHFEIMLIDNALMAILYLEAHQASGSPRYAAVARAILDDLLARFRLPEGGFAAALDAETEGAEGFYYTWTAGEVRAVLGAEAAGPFLGAYLDPDHGLVRERSVLRLLRDPESLLATQTRFAASLSRLRQARAERPAPLRDDKVLTSWNALAVSAFAKAAQVLGDARYYRVAREEMANLLAYTGDAGRLSHSRRGDKRGEEVFLDDYAFLIQALLDLYETDFQVSRLDDASRLMETLLDLFQAEPGRPFNFTPVDLSSDVPARAILREQGTPSGNAAALTALHRLLLFGAEAAFEQQTRAVSLGLGRYLEQSAASATGLLRALDFRPGEAREIVIVGNADDEETRDLLREVYKRLLPGAVLALIPPDAPLSNETWPLLSGRPLLDDKATAYVCRNRICELPVDSPSALAAQLDAIIVDGAGR